jgi:phenylpropionate dioxygenase-like ring-hydroxylating dioxygenase large terminal subunit
MDSEVLTKPLDIEDLPWGSQFLVNFYNPAYGSKTFETNEQMSHHVTAGSGHIGPNAMITWIKLSKDNTFHQYFFEAPIDENHTRIFFLSMRTFMLEPEMDERLTKISLVIAKEDIDILEDLTPVCTPTSSTKEVLVASDQAVIRYREYLREWEERGWRIDMETLRTTSNNIGYAIPSPNRRSSGNWVLDPVPTLPVGV